MHVLVIGVGGTGKSYLASRLRKKGFAVVDEGSTVGLTKLVDKNGRKAKYSTDSAENFWKNHFQVIDLKVLKKLLRENKTLYVLGDAGGQPGKGNGSFDIIGMFDKVYYLHASEELLESRLMGRTSKQFGKRKGELKGVFAHKAKLDKKAKALGILFVDAAMPVKDIVEKVSQ